MTRSNTFDIALVNSMGQMAPFPFFGSAIKRSNALKARPLTSFLQPAKPQAGVLKKNVWTGQVDAMGHGKMDRERQSYPVCENSRNKA